MSTKANNVFETFNLEFFNTAPVAIKWYDREGIYHLNKQTVAFITLSDPESKDHFIGYYVKVVSLKTGNTITNKFFRFSLHISCWSPGARNTNYRYAWFDVGKLDWYANRPVNTREMVSVIFEYLAEFKC